MITPAARKKALETLRDTLGIELTLSAPGDSYIGARKDLYVYELRELLDAFDVLNEALDTEAT